MTHVQVLPLRATPRRADEKEGYISVLSLASPDHLAGGEDAARRVGNGDHLVQTAPPPVVAAGQKRCGAIMRLGGTTRLQHRSAWPNRSLERCRTTKARRAPYVRRWGVTLAPVYRKSSSRPHTSLEVNKQRARHSSTAQLYPPHHHACPAANSQKRARHSHQGSPAQLYPPPPHARLTAKEHSYQGTPPHRKT